MKTKIVLTEADTALMLEASVAHVFLHVQQMDFGSRLLGQMDGHFQRVIGLFGKVSGNEYFFHDRKQLKNERCEKSTSAISLATSYLRRHCEPLISMKR